MPLKAIVISLLCLLAAVPEAMAQSRPDSATQRLLRTLPIASRGFNGDFDAMVERRVICVLVPYSRTLFINDRGNEHGLTAELVRDF